MIDHPDHAVVLGAGLAGLAHAATLADRFDRVTIVDRDVVPEGPAGRRGVPQDPHVHLLVPGGVQRLEGLLPGVLADLAARGGHLVGSPDWRFLMGGGRLALQDPDLRITGATRPLIEATVRDRVLALDGGELLDGWSAREPTTTDDRRRLTGVRLRSVADPDEVRTLDADLVVDATGRGSSAPRWLAHLGYVPPDEDRLVVDVHYVSRQFRRGPDDLDGCGNVLVDVPPGQRRGGVALAVEDDRWLVSLVGVVGERPPADLPGFVDYAASLWADDLHQIVAGAEPIGDASHHAFPAFSWHRYDALEDLPEGFAISGDAVCSFDPRFGQGMTVAITEAVELGHVLDRHGLDHVGERVLAASLPTVQDAWDLATGSDLAHPEVDGPRTPAWEQTSAYLQQLLPAAHHDPAVAAAFIRVVGMLDRPDALMRPEIRQRVVGRARAGAGAPPR